MYIPEFNDMHLTSLVENQKSIINKIKSNANNKLSKKYSKVDTSDESLLMSAVELLENDCTLYFFKDSTFKMKEVL